MIRVLFFFQAEGGIRDIGVTGVQTFALPISPANDFRLQQTGVASQTSAYSWLRSIEGGWLIELAWNLFGVDLSQLFGATGGVRSEERRVGKEGRSRWSPHH